MRNYIYETKCLRCDHVTELIYGEALSGVLVAFNTAMEEKSSRPFNDDCSSCKKQTMQIVTFYGSSAVVSSRSYIMMKD